METEPTVEQQWSSWESGGEAQAAEPVETETAETIDESLATETTTDDIPDNDDDLLGNDTTQPDSDLRAEMAALKQQFEQERLQYQEMLRRAQQSFRDSGASLLERVEQRLAPVQDTLADLVKNGLLTPEDANSRLQTAERQFRREEISRDQQARNHATRQDWLAQQQQGQQPSPQPQAPRYSEREIAKANERITAVMKRTGVTSADLEQNGFLTDYSHLSPIEAVDAVTRAAVATAKMKQALAGQAPQGGGNQFPYPNMGGGAGVPARGIEAISKELDAEMKKTNQDWDRITELSAALGKYLK